MLFFNLCNFFNCFKYFALFILATLLFLNYICLIASFPLECLVIKNYLVPPTLTIDHLNESRCLEEIHDFTKPSASFPSLFTEFHSCFIVKWQLNTEYKSIFILTFLFQFHIGIIKTLSSVAATGTFVRG